MWGGSPTPLSWADISGDEAPVEMGESETGNRENGIHRFESSVLLCESSVLRWESSVLLCESSVFPLESSGVLCESLVRSIAASVVLLECSVTYGECSGVCWPLKSRTRGISSRMRAGFNDARSVLIKYNRIEMHYLRREALRNRPIWRAEAGPLGRIRPAARSGGPSRYQPLRREERFDF